MTRAITLWHRFILSRGMLFKKPKSCRCPTTSGTEAWHFNSIRVSLLVWSSEVHSVPGARRRFYFWHSAVFSPLTFETKGAICVSPELFLEFPSENGKQKRDLPQDSLVLQVMELRHSDSLKVSQVRVTGYPLPSLLLRTLDSTLGWHKQVYHI